VRLDHLLQIPRFAAAVGGAEADGVENADPAATLADVYVLARPEVLKLPVQRGAVAEELVNVIAMKGAVDRRQIDLRGVTTQLVHQLPLIATGHARDGAVEEDEALERTPRPGQYSLHLSGHRGGQRRQHSRHGRLAEPIADKLQMRANHRALDPSTSQRLAADIRDRRHASTFHAGLDGKFTSGNNLLVSESYLFTRGSPQRHTQSLRRTEDTPFLPSAMVLRDRQEPGRRQWSVATLSPTPRPGSVSFAERAFCDSYRRTRKS
jgi:hypothetical protein